jgi:hypothetical protein
MTRMLVVIASPLSALAMAVAAPGAPGVRAAAAALPGGTAAQPAAPQGSADPGEPSTRYGTGDGVNLDPLGTCVSCTNASAGDNSSASESRELKVADESLADGQGPTNGYNGGSAVTLPPNSLLGLALGYFQMDNRAGRRASEAHSRATLADLRVADGQAASLTVFESRSDATWTPGRGARRDGTSNGVVAGLGGAGDRSTVVLLHSDSSSDGTEHAYLVHITDRDVGSTDQLQGGPSPLLVPRVGSVSVLQASHDGAGIGGVQDGSSNRAADVISSSAESPGDQH